MMCSWHAIQCLSCFPKWVWRCKQNDDIDVLQETELRGPAQCTQVKIRCSWSWPVSGVQRCRIHGAGVHIDAWAGSCLQRGCPFLEGVISQTRIDSARSILPSVFLGVPRSWLNQACVDSILLVSLRSSPTILQLTTTLWDSLKSKSHVQHNEKSEVCNMPSLVECLDQLSSRHIGFRITNAGPEVQASRGSWCDQHLQSRGLEVFLVRATAVLQATVHQHEGDLRSFFHHAIN